MKNVIKFLSLIFIIPCVLLSGACSLLNGKDDGSSLSQEQMFNNYLTAVTNSLDSQTYTNIVSEIEKETNEDDDILEYVTTKNETSYNYQGADSYFEYVVKYIGKDKPNSTYIKYTINNNVKSATYTQISEFNKEYGLLKREDDLKTLLGYKTKAKIVDEFETMVERETMEKTPYQEVVEEGENVFNFEKKNGKYTLTLEKYYIVISNNIRKKFQKSIKIVFTDKINKINVETSVLELDDNNAAKENGYSYVHTIENSITYKFDSSIAKTNFSDFPSPTN